MDNKADVRDGSVGKLTVGWTFSIWFSAGTFPLNISATSRSILLFTGYL